CTSGLPTAPASSSQKNCGGWSCIAPLLRPRIWRSTPKAAPVRRQSPDRPRLRGFSPSASSFSSDRRCETPAASPAARSAVPAAAPYRAPPRPAPTACSPRSAPASAAPSSCPSAARSAPSAAQTRLYLIHRRRVEQGLHARGGLLAGRRQLGLRLLDGEHGKGAVLQRAGQHHMLTG